MRRSLTCCSTLALLVPLIGCETEGFSIGSALTGKRQAVDIPEAAAAAADSEETVGWDRIVVGVRPYHRTVGYVETREFTPEGTHDRLPIAYIWPDTLTEPWGFVTAEGGAYRFRLDGSSATDFLGRMPIETACLHVLGVCPKCGHQLDRAVVENVARADLGPEYTRDFRRYVVATHRGSRDLHPDEGTALHSRVGGGVTLDHACEGCRDKAVQPLTGSTHTQRVQFEELTAADLAPLPVPKPAAAPAADADADTGSDDEG